MQRHLLKRAIAYTIDATIASCILSVSLVVIIVGMIASGGPDAELTAPAAIANAISFVVTIPLGFGFFLMRDGFGGGGPGKWIVGLRVVDIHTRAPCTKMQSFKRNLLMLAIGAVDCVIPFFREDGRRVGDTVANTIVVSSQEVNRGARG